MGKNSQVHFGPMFFQSIYVPNFSKVSLFDVNYGFIDIHLKNFWMKYRISYQMKYSIPIQSNTG